ncbi:hypothetical protein SS7213T_03095 [Staphylococcus simiae CCM 7213 = CCUG 51256]|uniref:Uncharacterized protein n=1 Tax=Staphylococcus simiae CCM 7213 = CCUG 51256 TaxID=911238 RepID=G5JGP8_9STAP|nr:hypothetical protein SS7213T_03095 [Staphylococcus simiae CCM 7213 = CCUG 51256]
MHLNDKVKISADQAKLTRLPNLTTVPLIKVSLIQ